MIKSFPKFTTHNKNIIPFSMDGEWKRKQKLNFIHSTQSATPTKNMSRKLPVAITSEEFDLLLKSTKKVHHRLAFLLGFESGLRISEINHLEPRDINVKEKNILVRQGKGSKDRIVPLPKRWKETMIDKLPIKIGVRALERAFLRAAKKANITEKKPSIHFHSLRHGFGTHMANQGVPIHHIRTLMGHSNISTTNIYLVGNPKDALNKYEELF